MKRTALLRISLLLALTLLFAFDAAASPAGTRPVVRVAYFVPSDCKAIPGYEERLDRVMTEVQRFYREGMKAAGYGPMTFALDRDESGKLRVRLVKGREPASAYGRNSAGKVRKEVRAALRRQGIDMDRETVVIFETLLLWKGRKAVEVGPYCGGGNHLAGTAWVYDDARLDPRLLISKKPGGYYHRPCSIGEFNSHYIGGIAHELGHAFGLPHVCQRRADRGRGRALMGAGNHVYGRELRGQGPGAFLTKNSAMLLSHARPFAGDLPGARRKPKCKLRAFDAAFEDGKLILTGRVDASPRAFGIAAYNDPTKRPADYDAVGWTCDVAKDGTFRLEIGELLPGRYQLRLRVCHVNGATSRYAFDYEVDAQGRPGLSVFRYTLPLRDALAAFARGDARRAETLARKLQSRFPNAETVQKQAALILRLLKPAPLLDAAALRDDVKAALVSRLKFARASVGWGKPLRDRVLPERPGACFLQVEGRFYDRGLYAHAPSVYAARLARRWKTLETGYGLQDDHRGSVVFVVVGDGKELFRSPLVKDHKLRRVRLDVSGVSVLELRVENGGDGATNDWGVWIEPRLRRGP